MSTIVLATPPTVSHRTAEETLALGYLGGVLRAHGHEVFILDGWLRGLTVTELARIITAKAPDVVCMSCYRSNLTQAEELLHLLRSEVGFLPVVCGGYGPSFHDEDFLKAGFSVAIRGEAEHIICSVVEALVERADLAGIPGVSFFGSGGMVVRTKQSPAVSDLDSLVLPARDEVTFTLRRKNPVHVCTSRGCAAHCSFCSIFAFALSSSKDGRWRGRSISSIVEELRFLHDELGVTHIKFVDDSFLEPPRGEAWVAEFANALSRHNLDIRFRTQVRADRLSEGIVQGLKSAGWFATSVGIENASTTALKRMKKTASAEDNLRALELLERFGVYVQAGMILFDHATTIEELEDNYQFLNGQKWIITKGIFTEMYAATGTQYAKKLSRERIFLSSADQNRRYEVIDGRARRVYQMLKMWHMSHAEVYDKIIDPLTAPKVLSDGGYLAVHSLCRAAIELDVSTFRAMLDRVESQSSVHEDDDFITDWIRQHTPIYIAFASRIEDIYLRYGLVYDGVANPFLT